MIDRSNLNSNPSTSSVNKVNCDVVSNTELQGYFFGIFLCNKSLTATPAGNIPIFAISTVVPHYKRSVRTEIVHMNDQDDSATVTIKPDDQAQTVVSMKSSTIAQTRMQVDCASSGGGVEADMDQFYRGQWTYLKSSSTNIKVAFDSTCPSSGKNSQFRISGIQVNISACHPSCQSCDGPLETNCLTCATSGSGGASGPVSGKCACLDPDTVFSYGTCVKTCNPSLFLFPNNNTCIYLANCLSNVDDSCVSCQASYFLADGQCLNNCPAGYQTNGKNCIYSKLNIQGFKFFQGLRRSDFSQITINNLGITMTSYLQQNTNTAIFSRCGSVNYLGGFFINQQNSVITFSNISNSLFKFISVTFKYVFVDYNDNGNSSVFVQLQAGSTTLKKEIIMSNSGQSNICGLNTADLVGVYSDNFELPSNRDFVLSITNTNSKCKPGSKSDTINAHCYFGIREIDVFGFNCLFDFCKTCTSTTCTQCIDGYYWNGTACTPCGILCETCNNATQCQSCIAGFILDLSNKCVCQNGFYLSNNTCIACTNSNCKTCNPSNPSQCLSCNNPKYLSQSGDCLSNCPSAQYGDANYVCQNCSNTSCLTCNASNSSQCLSCATPNYLNVNACQPTCPDKFYGDTSTRKCIACQNTTCKTCNPPPNNSCLTCNSNQHIDTGSCVAGCADGYYQETVSNNCIPCGTPCKSCTPALPNYCLSCYPPLVLTNGVCGNTCPKGNYEDAGSKQCFPCWNSTCFACQFPNVNVCISCDTNQYMQGSDCVNDCQAGYYKSEIDKKCLSCPDTNCLACDSTNPSNCSKCKTPTALLNTSCVTDCGIGKYNNSSNQICTDCPASSNCKTCNASTPSNCTACNLPRGLLGSSCVTNCGDGKYIDSSATCKNCLNVKCKTCSDSNSTLCLSCGGSKVLYNQDCIDNCPDKYYKDTANNICLSCSNQYCKTCNAPPSQTCLSCSAPRALQGTLCVVRCDDGYYADSNQICQKCINPRCAICNQSDPTQCVSCGPTKALYQNDCLDNCPIKYYKQPITNICVQCQNNTCQTCDPDNPDQCLTCDPLLFLKDSSCVSSCGDGYYEQGQLCVLCDNQNCKTCDSNTSSNCLSCFPPMQLQSNQCEYVCPPLQVYDPNQSKCVQCGINCLTCSPDDILKCRSCSPPLVLIDNDCQNQCREGMYVDNSNTCQDCQNTDCSTCDTTNTNKCLSCKTPKLLQNGVCVDKCDPNMYIDNNIQCLSCTNPTSQCDLCLNTDPSVCISCVPPLILFGHNCVSSCGKGYVVNSTTNTCEICTNPTCHQCNPLDKNECTSCDPPLILLLSKGQCVDKCLDGMFVDDINNICVPCLNSTCKTCNKSQSDKCLSCKTPLHLKNDLCITDCGKGYYLDVLTNSCLPCTNTGNNCLSCDSNNPTLCLSCEAPLGLSNNNCVQSCGAGQVINTNNQTCVQCQNTNCITCNFPITTQCLTCDNTKILSNGDCLDKCPFNSYIDVNNNKCGQCTNPNCQYCDISNTLACTSCKSPKVKKGIDCVDFCDDNMYIDINLNTCKNCSNPHNQCKTCQNPPFTNKCTTCSDPFALLNDDCVLNCGDGYVKNPQTKICEACTNPNCKTCSLNDKNICLSCSLPQLIKNGDCVNDCGDQMYEDNFICKSCIDQTCKKCKPQSNECTECFPPKLLFQRKCVSDCDNGWYKNISNSTCQQCNNPLCKSCDTSDSNICLSCTSPLVLLGINCVNSCGENYYIHQATNTCRLCSQNCKSCQNEKECLACKQGFFNFEGICIQNCPKEKFFENKDDQRCELCKDPNCLDCQLNINTCKVCMKGYSLPVSQNTNISTVCQKCEQPDCMIDSAGTKQKPTFTNEIVQKALTSTMTVISIFSASLSPFYMLVSFFDLLQVTNYLVYINVNYSQNLYSFLQLFSFANFEIIPNLKGTNSRAPYKFKQENVDTFLFSNLIQSASLWIASFLLYLAAVAFKPLGQNKISSLIKSYKDNYKYNIMIGLGFLTYCDIVLSVFLQLYDSDNIETQHIVGIFGSVIFISFIIGLNIVTYRVSNENQNTFSSKSYDKFLCEGYARRKSIINLIFLLRKTLIIYILVFKQEQPIYQGLQIFLTLGIEQTILTVFNPYKVKSLMKLNVLGRSLLLLSVISIIVMALDDQISNIGSIVRSMLELLVMASLGVLYLSQVMYLLYHFLIRNYRRNILSIITPTIKVI